LGGGTYKILGSDVIAEVIIFIDTIDGLENLLDNLIFLGLIDLKFYDVLA
jgi:hypothetical protein